MVFKQGDLILNFDRVRSSATDFIRSNPITTAAVALGVPLTFAGIATVRSSIKRRKKKKVAKRKKTRKRTTTKKRRSPTRRKKAKKRTHASPRHKGHKRVSFVTAGGKRVSFLVKPKRKKHSHK